MVACGSRTRITKNIPISFDDEHLYKAEYILVDLQLLEPNMDPSLLLVPIANLTACLLVLLSMSKNMFQSWNIGACSFAIWVAVESATTAIRAIIWSNNVENMAPLWCDISECPSVLHILRAPLMVSLYSITP